MFISVRANVRTAAAATRSYQEAIDVALRGGAVCGLLVVGLCVTGISVLFTILRGMFPELPAPLVASLLVGFGFGASLVALFAQLGGGIYTKAADVGADLVGKVEVRHAHVDAAMLMSLHLPMPMFGPCTHPCSCTGGHPRG